MPSEYRHTRRVQFYETDTAGFVHFSWFFRYMEEAEHALWREAGLSIAPAESEIAWPRVAASFEFYRPLRFEEEFDVWLGVVELTARTIRYTCLLTLGDTQIASGSLTIACVRRSGRGPMQATDIPPEIARRFQVARVDD